MSDPTTNSDADSPMLGRIFVALGDISQLAADALIYSTDVWHSDGLMSDAFRKNIPCFAQKDAEASKEHLGSRPHLDLGEAYWVPLQRKKPPYGVVVVAVTQNERADKEAGAKAVTNAVRTAVKGLRCTDGCSKKRYLIALPAFRMGKGGDRERRLASAREQMEAAVEVLKEYPNVDLAFITYTPDIYEIYVGARREVGAEPPGPTVRAQGKAGAEPAAFAGSVQPLVESIGRGQCVLFVGAGLSQGAGSPGYTDLIQEMCVEMGIPVPEGTDQDTFLDVAQWYRDGRSKGSLGRLMQRLFADHSEEKRVFPSLAHYLLMSLPIRHVVTTNYDELLEETLRALRRHPVKVVCPQEVAATGRKDGVSVVKFHGDIVEKPAPTSPPTSERDLSYEEQFVVSRDDYEDFFARRPVMASLLEGLLLNQTFLFVGYSLRDPNFRQVFHRIHRMLEDSRSPAFAVRMGGVDDRLREQWRKKQLELLPMPGKELEEQTVELLSFLDWLARTALSESRLFLAEDAAELQQLPHLEDLRASLKDVGTAMQQLDFKQLSPDEARQVSRVLAFLTEMGWSPEGDRARASGHDRGEGRILKELWETLAGRMEPEAAPERKKMLIRALAACEEWDAIQTISKKLQGLDQHPDTAE